MNLRIPKYLVKAWAAEVGLDLEEDRIFPDGMFYSGRTDKISIDSQFLTDDQIDKLLEMAKAGEDRTVAKSVQRQLRAVRKARTSNKSTIPNTLPLLKELLHKYIESAEHRWLFTRDGDILEPVIVTDIKYEKRRKDYPGHVVVSYSYRSMGRPCDGSISFYREVLKHSTIQTLLEKNGFYLETLELLEDYKRRFDIWKDFREMYGEQFWARGKARREGSRFRNFVLATEGLPTKVIMDEFEGKVSRTRIHYWDTPENLTPDETLSDDEQDEQELGFKAVIPTHLYLRVFSLVLHEFFEVLIDDLELYVYDESLIEKLILPDDVKELIDFVITSVGKGMSDIIKGKSAGVVILSKGLPGVGKTLTGEVYSEKIGRPLYIVQAAQLGLTIDDLEGRLKDVLERAAGWRALLMIDESDVYIHERGNDMIQNAVVGTFLRVLEYYQGVLFMTTNRATVIDDAILSRCNAVVQYDPPTKEAQGEIWVIISNEFGVELDAKLILSIVDEFYYLTGREIKNLLKLAVLYAARMEVELSLKVFQSVSKYQHYVNKPSNDH